MPDLVEASRSLSKRICGQAESSERSISGQVEISVADES